MPPIPKATESLLQKIDGSLMEFKTHHLYLGAASELIALDLLGVPWVCVGASESKGSCRDFVKRRYPEKVAALWTTADEVAANSGFCRTRGQQVVLTPSQPHCSSSRLPVPQTNASAVSVAQQVAADATASWFNHLRNVRPHSWWVEFPGDFAKSKDNADMAVFVAWCKQCRTLDYSIVHFRVPHNLWIAGSQHSSLIVCGFSTFAGAIDAVKWFAGAFHSMLVALRQVGPIEIWKELRASRDGSDVRRSGWLTPEMAQDELSDEGLALLIRFST